MNLWSGATLTHIHDFLLIHINVKTLDFISNVNKLISIVIR